MGVDCWQVYHQWGGWGQLRCGKFGVRFRKRGLVAGREWAPAFAGVGKHKTPPRSLVLRQAQDEGMGRATTRVAPTGDRWMEGSDPHPNPLPGRERG